MVALLETISDRIASDMIFHNDYSQRGLDPLYGKRELGLRIDKFTGAIPEALLYKRHQKPYLQGDR